MKILRSLPLLLLAFCLFQAPAWASGDHNSAVTELQQQWDHHNYQLDGKARKEAFQSLVEKAEGYLAQYPDDPALLVWSGIIKSTYAGVKGGLGALKYAKDSRKDLEKALKLDPLVLNGSAYTSLGTLYSKVPGWPLGFGDDEKAEGLLKRSLEVNPDGIDPNYFYGEYLYEHEQFQQAEQYLVKARQAPHRPGRSVADQGRQKEVVLLLENVRNKLK